MKRVLVTGARGQLGQCFQKVSADYPDLEFIFADSQEFDISLPAIMDIYLRRQEVDYCINCAAYTKVELAETNREMAFHVNSDAVKHLAQACSRNGITLVHFSTDYVFDGRKDGPYTELDEPCPINVYGGSKLSGEECIAEELDNYFIFRTSWLYSDIGHNFYNTIREKAAAGEQLNITTEQRGTPTNAYDLARFVLTLISSESKEYGLYHYSNLDDATWYEFAAEILRLTGYAEKVELRENNNFPSMAQRPERSILSKDKLISTFQQDILPWKESLARLVRKEY